jgi:hypothetical protein
MNKCIYSTSIVLKQMVCMSFHVHDLFYFISFQILKNLPSKSYAYFYCMYERYIMVINFYIYIIKHKFYKTSCIFTKFYSQLFL